MKRGIKLVVSLVFVVFLANIFLLSEAFAENKIVYVDLAAVFDGYEKTKDYDVNLEETQNGKQTEIDAMVEEIKGMQDKLDLLTDSEKKSKEEEIDKKTRELQEFQRSAEVDLRETRNERLKEVLEDIQEVVEEIAKQNKYDYILNDRVLLYGGENLDISDEVLKKLNERYKKKN
ncbi:OmpH family outer membrane protein [Candidatus Omnitrophota bacterium]